MVRLFLTKTSVPQLELPGGGGELRRRGDLRRRRWGSLILLFAFTQGVFPKPPDFAKLNAFDLSYFAAHPRFALFLLTVAVGGLAGRGRAAERRA